MVVKKQGIFILARYSSVIIDPATPEFMPNHNSGKSSTSSHCILLL
jgi:hypothetical protein